VTKTSHPVDALVRAALYGGAQRYLADEQDPTSRNAHRDMTARRAVNNNNNNHRFTAIIKVTQPALGSISSEELEDFVGAKFCCPHALADGNQRIRIREKTLEFSTMTGI